MLDLRIDGTEIEFSDWLDESEASSYDELLREVAHHDAMEVLIQKLEEVFWSQTGEDKKVGDYFLSPRNEWGYLKWWPGAFTDCGIPLKPRIVEVERGTVINRALR